MIQSVVVIAEKLGEWSIEVGLYWAILVNQGGVSRILKRGKCVVSG